MPKQPDKARPKGDEHLLRLLGRKAPRMPVVQEPPSIPVSDDELSQSEEPDPLAGVMRKTGATREELEEEARDLGFL